MNHFSIALSALASLALVSAAHAQSPAPAAKETYGIGLEGFAYPYPVQHAAADQRRRTGAHGVYGCGTGDAERPHRSAAAWTHFPSSYWAPVIKTLTDAGYRVVVPDQIGFGKSSKPTFDLHFDILARNTVALLDHLQLKQVDVVAHSLGGMLRVSHHPRLSGSRLPPAARSPDRP